MDNNHFSLALNAAVGGFISMLIIETVVKPTARVTGRFLLRKLDDKIKWIPDFLSKKDG
jgi:hypothetical protein